MTLRNTEWTSEQDAIVREMWAGNSPAHEISARVGHCRTAVFRRATLLGLPKRPRGGILRPSRVVDWPAAVDAMIRRLWAEGLGEMAIGTELNMGREMVRRRAAKLGLAPRTRQTRRKETTTTIKCLRCKSPFPSIDCRANRICQDCKERKSWRRGDFIYNTDHSVRI